MERAVGDPTYTRPAFFARPAGKISKRSNFFVFGTLRNLRPFLKTAGGVAFDGGGADVGFFHFGDLSSFKQVLKVLKKRTFSGDF